MSWVEGRRGFLLGAAALLSACGFTPVFAPGSAAAGLRTRVAVSPLPGRRGFLLREGLRERFGDEGDVVYVLDVVADYRETALSITQGAETTRFNIEGQARYTLRSIATDAIVSQGSVRSVAAYSATGSPFAVDVAQRDAEDRLATRLAEQIAAQVFLAAEDFAP
ncbi:MAG: LPS assembly lipoprotein LptE [Rubricella sp.]